MLPQKAPNQRGTFTRISAIAPLALQSTTTLLMREEPAMDCVVDRLVYQQYPAAIATVYYILLNMFQKISAFTVTILILLVCLAVFSVYLATRSHLVAGERDKVRHLRDSSFVYRNQFGIPHIVCGDEIDAYFTLGYVHAQDRLFQMDLMRRVGRGKLSEILGERTVGTDKFFKALGIESIAERVTRNVSKQSLNAMDAYSKGVNQFIEEHKNSLPLEFDALGYVPEYWRPSDCIVIARLMAFDMSMSFWTDIAFAEIADRHGMETALECIPGYSESAPFVTDGSFHKRNAPVVDSTSAKPPLDSTTAHDATLGALWGSKQMQGVFASLAATMNQVRKETGMRGMSSGSNCWAIKKSTKGTSSAILANDPHLTLGLPPRWYQVHISCKQFNVIGTTIPGSPGVVSGRNDNIAWGITNVMNDDVDYFIEKVDSKNLSKYYNASNELVKFKYVRDTVRVRIPDSDTNIVRKPRAFADSVFDYRATPRSAVISDVHIAALNDDIISYPASGKFLQKFALTFSWTARSQSDEMLTLLRLQKAKSWEQFVGAVQTWNTPALNFTYADRRGNIGVAPSGFTAIRGEGNPNLPSPGWLEQYAWKGIRQPDMLPRLYNPERGYVFSANNKTSNSVGFHISDVWEPSSRAERIGDLLSQFSSYTTRDAKFMQIDIMSPNAKYVLGKTLPVLEAYSKGFTEQEKDALGYLRSWDFTMSSRDVAPTIYSVFHERLMYNFFTKKMSPDLYKKYAFVGSLPMRKLNEIIADNSGAWLRRGINSQQMWKDIIAISFKDAVQYLDNIDSDVWDWQYSKIHYLDLKHPFHDNLAMRGVVSQTLEYVNGDATTINNALWRVHDPFSVTVGASMRFITDVSDSVVYSIVPGGSSGQPMDAHYTDQLQLWQNGGYVQLNVRRKPDATFSLTTTLIPKR